MTNLQNTTTKTIKISDVENLGEYKDSNNRKSLTLNDTILEKLYDNYYYSIDDYDTVIELDMNNPEIKSLVENTDYINNKFDSINDVDTGACEDHLIYKDNNSKNVNDIVDINGEVVDNPNSEVVIIKQTKNKSKTMNITVNENCKKFSMDTKPSTYKQDYDMVDNLVKEGVIIKKASATKPSMKLANYLTELGIDRTNSINIAKDYKIGSELKLVRAKDTVANTKTDTVAEKVESTDIVPVANTKTDTLEDISKDNNINLQLSTDIVPWSKITVKTVIGENFEIGLASVRGCMLKYDIASYLKSDDVMDDVISYKNVVGSKRITSDYTQPVIMVAELDDYIDTCIFNITKNLGIDLSLTKNEMVGSYQIDTDREYKGRCDMNSRQFLLDADKQAILNKVIRKTTTRELTNITTLATGSTYSAYCSNDEYLNDNVKHSLYLLLANKKTASSKNFIIDCKRSFDTCMTLISRIMLICYNQENNPDFDIDITKKQISIVLNNLINYRKRAVVVQLRGSDGELNKMMCSGDKEVLKSYNIKDYEVFQKNVMTTLLTLPGKFEKTISNTKQEELVFSELSRINKSDNMKLIRKGQLTQPQKAEYDKRVKEKLDEMNSADTEIYYDNESDINADSLAKIKEEVIAEDKAEKQQKRQAHTRSCLAKYLGSVDRGLSKILTRFMKTGSLVIDYRSSVVKLCLSIQKELETIKEDNVLINDSMLTTKFITYSLTFFTQLVETDCDGQLIKVASNKVDKNSKEIFYKICNALDSTLKLLSTKLQGELDRFYKQALQDAKKTDSLKWIKYLDDNKVINFDSLKQFMKENNK